MKLSMKTASTAEGQPEGSSPEDQLSGLGFRVQGLFSTAQVPKGMWFRVPGHAVAVPFSESYTTLWFVK